MAEQTKGRQDLTVNIHVNELYCLSYETNPIQKFNSVLNVASETSASTRSMSHGLAIVNWGGKQENDNF